MSALPSRSLRNTPRRIGAVAALGVLFLGACSGTPPGSDLPDSVWVRRTQGARIGPLHDLDTRLAPGGEAVSLELPTAELRSTLEEGSLIDVGGSMWSDASAEDVARDPALRSGPALLEFEVAARDGSSVRLVKGATRSAPDSVRYSLSARAERVGDDVWWEFRKLPPGEPGGTALGTMSAR